MNRIPIPLHPTAYGLDLACPEWPTILAELTEAGRRGNAVGSQEDRCGRWA